MKPPTSPAGDANRHPDPETARMPMHRHNVPHRLRMCGLAALACAASWATGQASASSVAATPPATPCQISLDNPDIAFGRINPYDLPDTGARASQTLPSVGRQLRTLQVQCSAPTRFALRFRAAADSSRQGYALGEAGVVLVSIARALADGNAAQLTTNPSPVTLPVNPVDAVGLKPDYVLQVVTQGQIGPLTQLTLQVEIDARLRVHADKLRQDQPFDSEGSFEVQPLSF